MREEIRDERRSNDGGGDKERQPRQMIAHPRLIGDLGRQSDALDDPVEEDPSIVDASFPIDEVETHQPSLGQKRRGQDFDPSHEAKIEAVLETEAEGRRIKGHIITAVNSSSRFARCQT